MNEILQSRFKPCCEVSNCETPSSIQIEGVFLCEQHSYAPKDIIKVIKNRVANRRAAYKEASLLGLTDD